MPVYHGDNPQHFKECLESIASLSVPTDVSFTLCFAIDGDIPAVLDDKIQNFVGLGLVTCRTFRNDTQSGLSSNINQTLNSLNFQPNSFIMRMDADDLMIPNRLVLQLDFLNKNPDVDVVAGCANRIDNIGQKIGQIGQGSRYVWPNKSWQNPIIHPTTMIRADFFKKYGVYDIKFKYAQDWHLWARASNAGAKFFVLPDKILKFRFSSRSVKRRKQTQRYVIKIAFTQLRGLNVKCIVILRAFLILIMPRWILIGLIKFMVKVNTTLGGN